jgi:hypothetical protein
MQPEKKQLEILLMDYFRNCYPDFPKGSVVPSESPDFRLKMKNKHLLGIELTRLNPENASVPNEEQLQNIEFYENLIQFTFELFQRKSDINLFVKFLFTEKKKMAQEKEMMIAVQTANVIYEAVQGRKKKSFFKESILKPQLPEGLEEILIVHHPKMKLPFWERSNNLGVSNDVVDDIRQAIRKKDEKLRLYQKNHLNYYWLLITTDRLRGVKSFNWPNKIMNHQFESRFQHVFLFDLIKSEIYELV